MNVLLFPFMLLAAAGLLLSVAIHVAAILGLQVPGGSTVWGLHIGIFVVWLPTVLVFTRTSRFANQKDLWKVALSGCPVWMRRTLYALFAYAIVNFAFFMLSSSSRGSGSEPGTELRGFSGHWMVFYGAAFATLYSAINAPQLFRERRCSRGHTVSPTAQFCPECGDALPRLSRDA